MSKFPPISEIIILSGRIYFTWFFLTWKYKKLVSELTSEAGILKTSKTWGWIVLSLVFYIAHVFPVTF